jgi:hypothetical protein
MEENRLGLEIKTDIKDYPHLTLVEDDSAKGTSKEINISQFNVLIKFKQICINKNLIPNFDYFDDYYLLKFCRARKFDLEKTLKMFTDFINWRKENDVDCISENFILTEFDELLKIYPHGFHKVDKTGHPIYYQLLSKLNPNKLFETFSSETLIKYFVQLYENMMKYRFKACSKLRGEVIEEACIILDIEGIGITDLFGKTRSFLILTTKISQDYYPCNMSKMFLINTNRFFGLVYNIVKGLIDLESRKKIELLGNDYKEKVLEYVDPDNLPTFLGGNCTCPNVPGGCLYCDIGPWNPKGKKFRYTPNNND